MLYQSHLKTHPPSIKMKSNNFSFIDSQSKPKRYKPKHDHSPLKSQHQTNSCTTCDPDTICHQDKQKEFFSEHQFENTQNSRYQESILIQKQINYNSPQEYQEKLETLLRQINISNDNKIYIRLIVVDKQLQNDQRLEEYFQWVMEKYRELKQKNYILQQSSALCYWKEKVQD